MDLSLNVLGWFIMLVGISLSIALHEVGHLVTAKKFGVKVTEYMVGFGPRLFSRQRGETEYGIKAIPLGGYIRMIGMLPPVNPDRPEVLRTTTTGRMGALVDDARQTAADEIGPEDADRVFYKLPVRQKLVVMLGGPTMNLIISAILFTIAFMALGLPTPSNVVGYVAPCIPTEASLRADKSLTNCPNSPSPAAESGLKVGDRIVSFNGVATSNWEQVRTQIRTSDKSNVPFTVERDGKTVRLTTTLVQAPRPTFNDQDEIIGIQPALYFGLAPTEELVKQSFIAVPKQMWDITKQATRAIITLPVRMYDLTKTVFGGAPRDPNGLVGVVGVGRISGEVVAAEGIDVQLKALQILGLLAGLNLFLFLFNLIPLLPLDGGYAIGAVWEGIKRGWARMRGKPDPGPVDVAKALPLAYGISIVLILMGVLLVWADLFKPITLGL